MAVSMTPQALGQMQTASEPFVWGSGSRRMTPEDIAREQKIAAALMQPDFSPVGHWTQGLGRVAEATLGNLRQGRADKASDANAAENASIAKLLMSPAGEVPAAGGNPSGGISPAIAQALSSPYVDDTTRRLAMRQFDLQNRKPIAPHYWEMNDGSLGMVGQDGKPQVLFKDPTPKINWITAENPDGTKSLIPMGPNGPLGAGGQPGAAPPGITFTPIEDGGPTPSASGGFRR